VIQRAGHAAATRSVALQADRDGETRTRTGDTTMFSRVVRVCQFAGFAGLSYAFSRKENDGLPSQFPAFPGIQAQAHRLVPETRRQHVGPLSSS